VVVQTGSLFYDTSNTMFKARDTDADRPEGELPNMAIGASA
jgi:hypothetical protein